MPVKSFRGKLVDTNIDIVTLHTNTGSTGYRIKKFMLMPVSPATDNGESIVKVYKVKQTTATTELDFNDNTLLAAGYVENHAGEDNPITQTIFFDNEIVNQDVYLTCKDGDAAQDGVNYYLELEQIKLDLNQNTVATLKDIRNTTQ